MRLGIYFAAPNEWVAWVALTGSAVLDEQVYTVSYAVVPNDQRFSFEFKTIDNTIKCCFFLTSKGYQIDRVTLPNGLEVGGESIRETMLAGISATQSLLK